MAFEMDKSTMWEAFVGGQAWGTAGSPGQLTAGQIESDEEYAQRVENFYNQVVGPAFGYTDDGEGFGSAFERSTGESWFTVGAERDALDQAEREFRLAIGDPYGEDDPFSWENISRYGIGDDSISEAQKLLEGELYDKGDLLGGEAGSEYGLSMDKQELGYASGLKGLREGLTYEGLTGGAGLASGTSGSVLRSGTAAGQAEDILEDTFKESQGIGSSFEEGKELTERQLKSDLDSALSAYTTVIENQKQSFMDNILKDIQVMTGLTDVEGTFGGTDVQQAFDLQRGEEDWGGVTYADQLAAEDDPDTEEIEGFEFRGDEACGIGHLWDQDSESCQPIEGLTPDPYGKLCPTGAQDCNGVCDGPAVMECAGVCEGSAEVDECGVCEGDGSSCLEEGCGAGEGPPSVQCDQGGFIVCDISECPEMESDPEGEAYIDCPAAYGAGWTWDPVSEQCENTGDTGFQFGTDSCHQPYNTCPPGTCCNDAGMCTASACEDDDYVPDHDPDRRDRDDDKDDRPGRR